MILSTIEAALSSGVGTFEKQKIPDIGDNLFIPLITSSLFNHFPLYKPDFRQGLRATTNAMRPRYDYSSCFFSC